MKKKRYTVVFNVAAINLCTETEGIGKRLAIWFQGCDIRCAGCCNPDMQDFKPVHLLTLSELLTIIKEAKKDNKIEGITYLGGEPTLQKGLSELSKEIHQIGLGIILFTGKSCKDLDSDIKENVDLIVDGSFDNSKIDNERNMIGSKNQKIISVTERYKNELEWFYIPRPKIVECNITDEFIFSGDVVVPNSGKNS